MAGTSLGIELSAARYVLSSREEVSVAMDDPWGGATQQNSPFPHYGVMLKVMVKVIWRVLWWKIFHPGKTLPWVDEDFDGVSQTLHRIREGAATWRALDILYNRRIQEHSNQGAETATFWFQFRNAQAVYNRMVITRLEVYRAIIDLSKRHSVVNILSIASGSAQAVLEAACMAIRRGAEVQLFLLDKDPSALKYAKQLAEDIGLPADCMTVLRNDVRELENVSRSLPQIHMVEMVGFLDYRETSKAVRLIRDIYKMLPVGGYFITAQIAPNLEALFLRLVLQWRMVYRTKSRFIAMLEQGGFAPRNMKVVAEAQNIHHVASCCRDR